MKLAGKVAIVTGGGTGIGLGISRVLASHGAKIAVAQIDTPVARFTIQRCGMAALRCTRWTLPIAGRWTEWWSV